MIKPVLSIIIKEIKLLLRDPGSLIMLFILPAIFIFVLSIALQGAFSSSDVKNKMNILVVNRDEGETGGRIAAGLEENGYFNVISSLDNRDLTLDMAKSELHKGKFKIAVYIPPGTTSAVNLKGKDTIEIYVDPILSGEFVTIITGAIQNFVSSTLVQNIAEISSNVFDSINRKRITEIDAQLKEAISKRDEIESQMEDFTSQAFDEDTLMLIEKLSNDNIRELNRTIAGLQRQKKAYMDPDNKEKTMLQTGYIEDKSDTGLKVKQFFYSAGSKDGKTPNSVQQNVPGWTIFALFWIVQMISLNIIMERQSGAYKRILISPINKFQYLTGKIIPFFIINLFQALFMFIIGIYILPLFGSPRLEITNYAGVIAMTVTISFVAISMGLFFATIAKSMFLAASMAASVLIIMTVIGGIMVPKYVMPSFMQTMSLFVPQGWALDGYLNLIVKNYPFVDILPNIGVLLLFGMAFFLLGFIGLNRFTKDMR